MRTLVGGSAYFNQAIQPRVFVRVFDGATDILVQGTEANGTYEDRIASFDNITSEIDPAGGMSTVSGGGVKRLTLDEDFTLCTTASLEPEPQSAYAGAGRLICQGVADGAYADTRNATACTDFGTPAISVGRILNGSNAFAVIRAFLQFKIPAGMTTLEDAYIALVGIQNGASTAFTVQGVAGTWSNLSSTTGLFNDFDGWAASGTYTLLENLLETWTTAEYDATATYLRFNEAGRAAIKNAAGGIFRLILISNLDSTMNAGPSGNEYVTFESSSARLALRYNSVTLDNKDVEILLGFDPVTTINSTALDVVTTQIVDTWRLDGRELDMTFRANDFKENPTIPAKIITLTDWPNCPEENTGKAYPVVYGSSCDSILGEHKAGIGFEKNFVAHTLTNEEIGLFDYFPCPVVDPGNTSSESPMQILVSGAAINRAYLGVPAVWDSSAKAWARMVSTPGVVQGTTHQYMTLSPDRRIIGSYDGVSYTDADVYEDFIGPCLSIVPSYVKNSSGVTSPEAIYAAGASLDTAGDYVTVGFSSKITSSASEKVEIVFSLTTTGNCELYCKILDKDELISGADGVIANSGTPGFSTFTSAATDFNAAGVTTSDRLWIYGPFGGVSSAISSIDSDHVLTIPALLASSSLEFKIIKTTDVVHTFTNIMKNAIGSVEVVLDATEYMTKTPDNYFIQIYKYAHSSGEAQVSYLQVKYYSQNGSVRDVGLDKQGYAFGSWIDAAGRSNSSDEGALIENPAHVIEALARNEMSLATADIDTAAFDTAASAVSGCKFAFQLNDRKDARDILDGLGKQARTFLRWNESDKLTIKIISSSDAFGNSETATPDVPGAHDIFTTTGDPVSGVFAHHQLLSDVRIELSDADDHCTTFVLKYRQNYATGDYAAVLTCDKDAENLTDGYLSGTTGTALKALCSAAYTRSGKINTLEMECPYIRDETTATLLMQHLIEWYSVRRYTLEFTAGISALCFVEGDFINVRTDTIENLFGTAVMNRKKWLVKRRSVSLNDMTITFTAIEA